MTDVIKTYMIKTQDFNDKRLYVKAQNFNISEYFVVFYNNNSPVLCMAIREIEYITEADSETKEMFNVEEYIDYIEEEEGEEDTDHAF